MSKINVRSFFAPNHIYDKNTLKALKDSKIKIVSDGYGLFPFFQQEILFIPQLFYKEIILPFGIQSTQMHINQWKDEDYKNFEIPQFSLLTLENESNMMILLVILF